LNNELACSDEAPNHPAIQRTGYWQVLIGPCGNIGWVMGIDLDFFDDHLDT